MTGAELRSGLHLVIRLTIFSLFFLTQTSISTFLLVIIVRYIFFGPVYGFWAHYDQNEYWLFLDHVR